MNKVAAYLQGGLGNQCFIYAAACTATLRGGLLANYTSGTGRHWLLGRGKDEIWFKKHNKKLPGIGCPISA